MERELYRVPLTSQNKEKFKSGKELLSSDFFGKYYRIRTYDEKYGYTYYIEQERIPLAPDWFHIELMIGEENFKLFNAVKQFAESEVFTRDSLDYGFRNFPAIRSLVGIGNDLFNGIFKGVDFMDFRMMRRYICYPSAFWPYGYIEKTSEFRRLCNQLLDELESGVKLNINDFKINEELVRIGQSIGKVADKVPSWVYKAIAIGGIICVKVLIKDALNDTLNDMGNDFDSSSVGGDGCNYDSISVGDGYTENPSIGPTEGYNIPFMAQSETLYSQGNGSQIDVTITKEPNTSNKFCIKLPDGTKIHDVSGTANTIKIGQIVYKLPTLKG